MDEQRTYGIEIETVCSISRFELADRINTAVQQFGHTCVGTHYMHSGTHREVAERGINYTEWQVKPDGSLRNAEMQRGYNNDAEIVSPVLKGHEGLLVLKTVCDVINQYCKVNKSCGLHVHHGVQATEVRHAVNTWLAVEDTIFALLPQSRRGNHYCKRLRNLRGMRTIRPEESLINWMDATCMGDRYVSFNLQSFLARGTIEFRCAAGTTEYDKMVGWLLATQAFISKAQINPLNDIANIDTICNWISSGLVPAQQVTINNVAGQLLAHRKGAGFMRHKAGSKAERMDHLLAEGNTLEHMANQLMTGFNLTYATARNSLTAHVSYLRQQGCFIEQRGRGDMRWIKVSMPVTTVEVPANEPVEAPTPDADYIRAAQWLRGRWDHFNSTSAINVA